MKEVMPSLEHNTEERLNSINDVLKKFIDTREKFNFSQLSEIEDQVQEWKKSEWVVERTDERDGILVKNYHLKGDGTAEGAKVLSLTYDTNMSGLSQAQERDLWRNITQYEVGVVDMEGRVVHRQIAAVDTQAAMSNYYRRRASMLEGYYEYHSNGAIKESTENMWDVGRGPYPYEDSDSKIFARGVERSKKDNNDLVHYGGEDVRIFQKFDEDGTLIDKKKWIGKIPHGTYPFDALHLSKGSRGGVVEVKD